MSPNKLNKCVLLETQIEIIKECCVKIKFTECEKRKYFIFSLITSKCF